MSPERIGEMLWVALVVAAVLPFAAWASPRWLRHTAARLLARADAIEHQGERMQFWSRQLEGEPAQASDEIVTVAQPIRRKMWP